MRSGREPASVQLVAISKSVPIERLHDAAALGLTILGENRVQEAADKVAGLPGVQWHLVGHLQGNKAARAVTLFDVVESVDSLDLARRLDRLADSGVARAARLPVYLQVNVDADPQKAGFGPRAIEEAIDELGELSSLELRGLMTVGRAVDRAEEARSTFAALAELSVRLRATMPALGQGLSMGMSDDFEVAVEEGATVVRVGRALFGHRPRV
ncbi:MAG: dependent protein [Chloroflexota bacterium]|jgi:pyridoxal phosphate enzyme (YggS family)|nr:dependent protein [Chloroflexota bacterium]